MEIVKFKSFDSQATCEDCDFFATKKNAHGLAAQHCYRTGHTVHIERNSSHTMTHKGSDWHAQWEKEHNK